MIPNISDKDGKSRDPWKVNQNQEIQTWCQALASGPPVFSLLLLLIKQKPDTEYIWPHRKKTTFPIVLKRQQACALQHLLHLPPLCCLYCGYEG
jgi:hypothetical protein